MSDINQHRTRIGSFNSCKYSNCSNNLSNSALSHSNFQVKFKTGQSQLSLRMTLRLTLIMCVMLTNLGVNYQSKHAQPTRRSDLNDHPPREEVHLHNANGIHSFIIQPISMFWSLSNKLRNKSIKSSNGNGRNTVNVTHWNMGSRFWIRKKHDIQLMLQDYNPDIAIITKANIFSWYTDYELHIPNYTLILHKTMRRIGNCRIAVLVKDGLNVQVMDNIMNVTVASVWLKVTAKGRRSLQLGAIYSPRINKSDTP